MENNEYGRPITETAAHESESALILPKSRKVYEDSYRKFIDYQLKNGTESFSEKDFLSYFSDLAKTMKSSTLWSNYSMLKSMVNEKHSIDIAKYQKLRTFLKQQSDGFVPQKSKTLNIEEIEKFLLEAPDNEHLATKVVLIFGVAGACRCDELYCLKKQHVEDLNNKMLVSLPHTKTNTMRSFVISEYLPIIRKYINSRPTDFASEKFFHKYLNGRGYRQVMGIHTFGRIPKKIASYLNLDNVELYTGHCLRRTSATLVNSGTDLLNLKRRRGWKTSTIAEEYIVHNSEHETESSGNISAPPSHSKHEATTAGNIQDQSTRLDADMTTKTHQDSNLVVKSQIDNTWRCRSCFEGFGLIDIFDTSIDDFSLLEIVKYCTNEQVPHDSELPSKLCNSCFGKFKETFVFIKEFKQTQEKLTNLERTLLQDHDTKIDIADNFRKSLNNSESGREIISTDDDKINIDNKCIRFPPSEQLEEESGNDDPVEVGEKVGLFHDHCYQVAVKEEILDETENIEMKNETDFVVKEEILDEDENIEMNNGEHPVIKQEVQDMDEEEGRTVAGEVNATSNLEDPSVWPDTDEGNMENFSNHFMLGHHNEPNRQCFKCLYIFPSVEDLMSHHEETGHDISPKYKCEICGAFFKFGPMYRRHIRDHEAVAKGLICEICRSYKRPGQPRHMQCDCGKIGLNSESVPYHANEKF